MLRLRVKQPGLRGRVRDGGYGYGSWLWLLAMAMTMAGSPRHHVLMYMMSYGNSLSNIRSRVLSLQFGRP